MFGHQDDSQQQAPVYGDTQALASPEPLVTPPADVLANSEPLLEAQASDGYIDAPASPPSAPALDNTTPLASTDFSQPGVSPVAPAPSAVGPNELLDIKQKALQQLSPLVGHLDQSPEEKFRTTMMMIQASDNQDLVQAAYDLAGQITDEKTRAQALLDIVNEINYFTQHNTAA